MGITKTEESGNQKCPGNDDLAFGIDTPPDLRLRPCSSLLVSSVRQLELTVETYGCEALKKER